MNRYKIIVAYDGTDYHGWQVQQGLPSIAQTLQDCFFKVFKERIVIGGASRTDAGVHAHGQIAAFSITFSIDPEKLKFAWNNALPQSIVIQHIEQVHNFSPYENVIQKTYWYHFFDKYPSTFVQRFGWYYRYKVDGAKLQQCLNIFVGTHDFRSFCTGTAEELTSGTIRTIDEITIEYSEQLGAHRIVVKGKKFLHHMIRRIVGACMEVASREDLNTDILAAALAAKNPAQILPNAPAKGLLLYKIEYDDNII